jgi:transposase-like protein
MEKTIKKGKRGAPYKFEPSFKRKVVQELYSGVLSLSEMGRKYNLGNSTITRWEQWYKEDQEQLLPSTAMKSSDKEPEITVADLSAPQRNESLEEELRQAKLKIICLETMIDVAEQTLQIEIRKKPGTKSSRE